MTKKTSDNREEFLHNIILEKSRVYFSNDPIVLLCGGKVKIKDKPSDEDPIICSLRHAINHNNNHFEFVRPEEYQLWNHFNLFEDLIDFETELAAVCSLLVLITESAGSIAELGAFSQSKEVCEKLFLIIPESEYKNEESFIYLGILRYLEKNHNKNCHVYSWDLNSPHAIEKKTLDLIFDDLKDEVKSLHDSEQFHQSNAQHLLVLICKLLLTFAALKEKEIQKYLNILGIPLSDTQIKRKLSVLRFFCIIKRKKSGDLYYYYLYDKNYHTISFKYKTRVDDIRFTMDLNNYYQENPKERHRINVISKQIGVR